MIELLSVPYTNNQLTIVLVACVGIGMYFGAMLVNVLNNKNKAKD